LHAVEGEVPTFLQMAESVEISGFSSGMRVTLGLGLLLRECKRAIEYEEDDVALETPPYIGSSLLDIKILDLVVDAVNKVRSGFKHLLKAKHVRQENAIIDNIVAEEGSGAVDRMDTTADREEGGNEEMLREKLADELKKKEEENCRHEELKQQEENSRLEKEREENEKRVAEEEKEKDEEVEVEEEEEEEEEEEMKGKKRTKSGGSRKPSKKVSSDVRRSSRARLPSKKAMKL
jgi:hypothetical protein